MNLYIYVLQKRGTATRAFLLEGPDYAAPDGWVVLTRIGRGKAAVATVFAPHVSDTTASWLLTFSTALPNEE